jgi:hypothetical protein
MRFHILAGYTACREASCIVHPGGRTIEAPTGEAVELHLAPRYLVSTLAIVSAPNGATPTIDGERVTFNQPGLYGIEVRMGEARQVLTLAVFPSTALASPRLSHVVHGPDRGVERSMLARRLILRSLAAEISAGDLAALTDGVPLPPYTDLRAHGAE